MKATELRIRNLVYFEINGKLEVHSIVPKDIHVMHICESQFNIECAQYKPIPLTEEWLLKAGKSGALGNIKINDMCNTSFQNKTINIYQEHIEDDLVLKLPDFVHQFQNLYFELTGNELTINL